MQQSDMGVQHALFKKKELYVAQIKTFKHLKLEFTLFRIWRVCSFFWV